MGACSGYLVETGAARIVCDLGAGTLPNLLRLCAVGEIDALILSHLHFDHCSDALVLQYALEKAVADGDRGPLPVYLPDTPAQYRALFDNERVFAPHALSDGLQARLAALARC